MGVLAQDTIRDEESAHAQQRKTEGTRVRARERVRKSIGCVCVCWREREKERESTCVCLREGETERENRVGQVYCNIRAMAKKNTNVSSILEY